jgi:hypothetical protein
MFILQQFIQKLHLTIDYIELNSSTRLVLRPLQTLTVHREHILFESRSGFVSEFETQRRRFLDYHLRHKSWSFQSFNALEKGKILVYEPENTLLEGACMNSSGGFFDDFDCPPIDTWFDFVYKDSITFDTDVLLAWVPEQYLEYAERGIEVSSTECVYWLEKSKSPFATMLRANGLLKTL